mmetsp:Transcript_9192/g.22475  ORF Transcript_9192/g.22475 Transcript_9192/m.22475 type:complete len:84 (+) Transcript_9192:475-726(+)
MDPTRKVVLLRVPSTPFPPMVQFSSELYSDLFELHLFCKSFWNKLLAYRGEMIIAPSSMLQNTEFPLEMTLEAAQRNFYILLE